MIYIGTTSKAPGTISRMLLPLVDAKEDTPHTSKVLSCWLSAGGCQLAREQACPSKHGRVFVFQDRTRLKASHYFLPSTMATTTTAATAATATSASTVASVTTIAATVITVVATTAATMLYSYTMPLPLLLLLLVLLRCCYRYCCGAIASCTGASQLRWQ